VGYSLESEYMPVCRICNKRVDLTQKGVKAYKCRICGRTVCPIHIDVARMMCSECIAALAKRK
jgi:tRNA(Ile2) C34 agmatinyltransferase TiaS